MPKDIHGAKFILDFFKQVATEKCDEFFNEFTDLMFAKLVKSMEIVSLPEMNTQLYDNSDPADWFYFVLQG